jgi:hypothetical protein
MDAMGGKSAVFLRRGVLQLGTVKEYSVKGFTVFAG